MLDEVGDQQSGFPGTQRFPGHVTSVLNLQRMRVPEGTLLVALSGGAGR